MSLENHSLTYSPGLHYAYIGAPITKTLKDWGINSAKTIHQNGGEDTLTVSLPRAIDAAPLFTPFNLVTLTAPDGSAVFKGVCTEPAQLAAGGETHTYTFQSPWYYLKSKIYRKGRVFAVDPTNYSSGVESRLSSSAFLFEKPTGPGPYPGDFGTIGYEMTQVLAAAAATIPIATGFSDVNNAIAPPEEHIRDLYIAEVIVRILRWAPEAVRWWNYNTIGSWAALQIGSAYDTLTLAADNRLQLGGRIQNFKPRPRYDMLISKYTITFLFSQVATDGSKSRAWISSHDQVSTSANGSPHEIVETVELRPPRDNGTDFDPGESVPDENLAELVHAPYKTLKWDVDFEIKGTEVDWSVHPGMKFNFTGAQGGLATAATPVQVITRDIGRGVTTYKCGFPNHLGAGDRMALIRGNRARRVDHNADGSMNNGSTSYSGFGKQRDKKPDGYHEIDVTLCDPSGMFTFLVKD